MTLIIAFNEDTSNVVLLSSLLTGTDFIHFSGVSIVGFEQVEAGKV